VRKFNYDRMVNADAQRVAAATMGVIDGVQRFDPAVQPLGMAAAFLLMCEAMGIEPQDVFTMARNAMVFRNTNNTIPEFRAVKQYIQMEIIR